MLALAAIPGSASDIELPSEIGAQVEQIRRLHLEKNPEAVAELNDAGAEAIYRWTAEALRRNTSASVVAALSRVVPIVRGEPEMSAQERDE